MNKKVLIGLLLGLVGLAFWYAKRYVRVQVIVRQEEVSEDKNVAGPDAEPSSFGATRPGGGVRSPLDMDVLTKGFGQKPQFINRTWEVRGDDTNDE